MGHVSGHKKIETNFKQAKFIYRNFSLLRRIKLIFKSFKKHCGEISPLIRRERSISIIWHPSPLLSSLSDKILLCLLINQYLILPRVKIMFLHHLAVINWAPNQYSPNYQFIYQCTGIKHQYFNFNPPPPGWKIYIRIFCNFWHFMNINKNMHYEMFYILWSTENLWCFLKGLLFMWPSIQREPDSQRYSLFLYLINNSALVSVCIICSQVNFNREPTIENIKFSKSKIWISSWSGKVCKCTVGIEHTTL